MSSRIKAILIVLTTFFLVAISCYKREETRIFYRGPSTVGTIIKLLIEGKKGELELLIKKRPESFEDTARQLLEAVEACLLQNEDPSKLLSEVVAHCAEKDKVIPLSAILDNAGAQYKLTPDNITASFNTAVGKKYDDITKTILDKALGKITTKAIQEAFKATASNVNKAPAIVAVILSNAQAQEKVGDAAIAKALKEALENNLADVEKAILAHWGVKTEFTEAITNNNAAIVGNLLSNAKT
ncbi:MAG: hypothetical protein MI674_07030, partial [Cytophagales bacterium]|nr:hypothetical protein [Cytophagales bacterium]